MFSKVSEYKVSDQKFVIMDFNITEQEKRNWFSYLVQGGRMKGWNIGVCVYIYKDLHVLARWNLILLVNTIENQFAYWAEFNLSWFGCIAVVKFKILQKCLFFWIWLQTSLKFYWLTCKVLLTNSFEDERRLELRLLFYTDLLIKLAWLLLIDHIIMQFFSSAMIRIKIVWAQSNVIFSYCFQK